MFDVSGISWISKVLGMLSLSKVDDQKSVFLLLLLNMPLF